MMWIMIIFDVNYDYFLLELLSLMSIMIILEVNYDGICGSLYICDVYFIS